MFISAGRWGPLVSDEVGYQRDRRSDASVAGTAVPLGATYDGVGTNFALFSEVAERVELCLFDDAGGSEKRLDLTEADGYVWHGFAARHRPRAALRLPRARAA